MLLPRNAFFMFSVTVTLLSAGIVSGQTTSTGSGQAASTGSGQAFPNKPIRVVSPGPGGGADFATRLIAQGISGTLGQQVIVDNRPTGIIPGEIVSRAPPDGYTLLVSGNSFWIGPLMQDNTPYDPVKDFSPVASAVGSPNILVVHPAVAANSVKELIALAKAKPGALNYATASAGGSVHLSAELFKYMAGVNMVRIPYKTSGLSVIGLVGGEVQLMFSNAAPVVPHVKAGKLKAFAVTTLHPSTMFPELPTIASSGLPGYDVASVYAVFAPAHTPVAIVNRLNQEIVRVLNRADVKEKLLAAGVEAIASSPQGLADAMKLEMTTIGKVIKDAGIRAD